MQWDERYGGGEFVYGKEPNDFLKEYAHLLPRGHVLCLAEGQGRNAVYLASLGHQVTALDASKVGLQSALSLAQERGVQIDTVQADLAHYALGDATWDGIVSIFCHLPTAVRESVLRQVEAALRPGGVFLLEAYAPGQLEYNTGGPKSRELLASLEEIQRCLQGLDMLHAVETERDVVEGTLHTGRARVVQVVAKIQ